MPLDWFPLPIFPEGALSASVIVTVWVGISIVCITNLRLGWVLSGLVVPGYMVPLLIVKPGSAIVVFAEGIVTYWLVWLYSEYSTRFTGLSSFFGRDRFFALVLTSVAVRIVADGWLLPLAGEWMLARYDLAFDYRNNLHSFGLIIVALIANNFWKTGLLRGAWPMAVQVGLTWLIVRYGLMEFTNFNMASLAFMYEDTASSFLATPKAYIVLLVTAFLASRLNLFYGWDFSGILIPSLLALEWFEPHKILTTLVETVVILGLAEVTLRLPMFRNITIEGARKLLLFFNLSFVYKFVLSWALVSLMPETKITDWFGFGYLLATLLALKMHDKGIFARVTAATLQTSLGGIAVATVVGFVLVVLPDPAWKEPTGAALTVLPQLERDDRPIEEILLAAKTSFYAASVGDALGTPLPRETDAFASGVRRLLEYRRSSEPQDLEAARRAMLAAHYEIDDVAGTYLLLRPQPQARSWGVFVLRRRSDSQLLVGVPAPVDEAGAYEAAVTIFARSEARAFATAGSARRVRDDGSSDVLVWPQTMFQVFHRELAPREVLQVRARKEGGSVLHLDGQVPYSLDLRSFERAGAAMQVLLSPSRERNLQRQTLSGSFLELWLGSTDAARIAQMGTSNASAGREKIPQGLGAFLRTNVTPATFLGSGTNAYRPPAPEELLRTDREVLSPLLALAQAQPSRDAPNTADLLAFSAAVTSGASLGLQVRWLMAPEEDYFLVADPARGNGWIAIRLGQATNYLLEVPRPVFESGILEMSLVAFTDLQARMLVLAGAAPDANPDGAADVLLRSNARSLFTLAHQVGLRGLDDSPGIALMVRAFTVAPGQPAPREDAVLSFDATPAGSALLPEHSHSLLEQLQQSGLNVRIGDGAADTATYDASGGPQASYLAQTRNKRFAVLWVSPLTRQQVDAEAASVQQRQFVALGLPANQVDVVSALSNRRMAPGGLAEAPKADAERFRATGDIVLLSAMKRRHSDLRLERLDDTGGRGAFLLVTTPSGTVRAVLSLSARAQGGDVFVQAGPIAPADARRFVSTRSKWMTAS